VVEAEITQRIDPAVSNSGQSDPIVLMKLGAATWLDVCAEPEVQRIVLIEAPAVLGWDRWREISLRYGMGLVQGLVDYGISVGRVVAQPVAPLSHVLIGALDEAALYVARADDPAEARREVGAVIDRLVQSIAA